MQRTVREFTLSQLRYRFDLPTGRRYPVDACASIPKLVELNQPERLQSPVTPRSGTQPMDQTRPQNCRLK